MTTEDSGIPAATAEGSFTNFSEIQADLDAIAAAEKVADDALEAAEQKIGIQNCPRWGLVTVQTDRGPHTWGKSEIEHAAAEGECYGANTTPEECARALAELERLERDGRAEDDRLGLTPLRAAVDAASERWKAAMELAASTPAQTVADPARSMMGVAIKLQYASELAPEITDQTDEQTLLSARNDAARLAGLEGLIAATRGAS